MKINTPKIYEQMSLRERAQLVFKCLSTQDEKTMDAIRSTVDRKHYTAYDIEYSESIQGLYDAAILWGFKYHQVTSQYYAYLYLWEQEDRREKEMSDSLKSILDGFGLSRKKLQVLFYLLDELAEKHGFDKKTVLPIAEIGDSQECKYPESFDINEVQEPEIVRFYDDMKFLLMGYINLHETRKQLNQLK